MADVVRINEYLSRTPRRETVRHEMPADILLFTGVRYERLTPAMLAASQRAKVSGKQLGKGPGSVRRP
jgi:hypothetical protein